MPFFLSGREFKFLHCILWGPFSVTLLHLFVLFGMILSARLSEKNLGAKFSFFVARTSILVAKNYINGFSFVKDNGLSLVYVFPKKRVTYLGGQVGDQA